MPGVLRAIGAAAVGLLLGAGFTPLPNVLAQWLGVARPLEKTAAIVVLGGGGLNADGTLTDVSLRRTLRGITLYRDGFAPLLLLSGSPSWDGLGEAQVRARFAVACGVASGAILIEDTSHTTREEARSIAARLAPHGARQILLVSDSSGMRRAVGVFQKAGLEVVPAPDDDVTGVTRPENRLDLMRSVVMELLGLLYYRIAGYV